MWQAGGIIGPLPGEGVDMEQPDTQKQIKNTLIKLELADITTLSFDAVVNAANSSLMGGAGVDGAIHYTGGPEILKECKQIIKKIGTLESGKAVITTGGNLPARYVIHTVGPIWDGGTHREAELLTSAYRESLALADSKGLVSIAFPSISTGVFSYPIFEASEIALTAIRDYILNNPTKITLVLFALFSHLDMGAYRRAMGKV